MAILKCKICGGDMEVSPDKSFGTCEYCGTTMTLPKIDDEQRAAAFNRGNHFRRTGEFDKALQVYERIITEDPNDAEAHWCCALCRYGIEWVEDPATMEYLPTCHRASFDIFTDDIDCKAAIELSDGVTKRQYQKDAVKIADVQKGILLTSQKEEPFDVFICYKETDEAGNRTVDSTLAQDVYYQLTDKGLRVFFARITLEDKAGSQYEPYIFAALHSAKVMVVIGTKPEHFSAVWVKNEWSRFLSLVKKDRNKALLPCYKDMDPYDLPEQLAVLQSYDMSKIGFIQDLIRGIEKIAKADKPKTAKETVIVGGAVNVAPLLKRAFMFLEDGNWQEADEYCERVLDQDPENAQAYLGKLMAKLEVKKQENLKDVAQPFDQSNNYQKILRFGDDAIKEKLKSNITYINERNETARKTGVYNKAVEQMSAADSEAAYKEAAETFQTIPGFKDADELAAACLEKAEECRKDAIYSEACCEKNEGEYVDAMRHFVSIAGWKDADEQCRPCEEAVEKLYRDAVSQMNAVDNAIGFKAASKAFEEIAFYKDSSKLAKACLEKAEECFGIQADAMAEAAKGRISLMKSGLSPQQLKQQRTLLYELQALSQSFESKTSELQKLQAESQDAAERLQKLQAERSTLGLFAGKRKREIDTEIEKCTNIQSKAPQKIKNLLTELKGFQTKKEIETKIGKIEDSIAELENQLNNPTALSYVQALRYYRTDEDLRNCFDSQYPDLKVAFEITFGHYRQSANSSPTPIEWIILDEKDGKVLVISKYALDCQRYNYSLTGVTWETCSLRKWLNETFINNAFSTEEQNKIQRTTVIADTIPTYSRSPGNNTTDKVFLLSIPEVKKYFSSDEARKCAPTEYAKAHGVKTNSSYSVVDGKAACYYWWLRSPGWVPNRVAYVCIGSIQNSGCDVDCDDHGIRPAMWISLD